MRSTAHASDDQSPSQIETPSYCGRTYESSMTPARISHIDSGSNALARGLHLLQITPPTNNSYDPAGPTSPSPLYSLSRNSSLRSSFSPYYLTARSAAMTMLTPPTTPSRSAKVDEITPRASLDSAIGSFGFSSELPSAESNEFDFDVSQGQLLGTGVWSKVYKITPPGSQLSRQASSFLTPPSTPQRPRAIQFPRALAVKTAVRPDAVAIFETEAQMLTHLQQHSSASQFVVPFLGFSSRNSALVFECAQRGTLEGLTQSPYATSAALLDMFLAVAPQLIAGLAFQHSAGVIHADIKPDNILLDSTDEDSDALLPSNILARFADFSASFLQATGPSPSQGGGTWAYMAPEQLLRDAALNTPTPASDIYALGITLLSLLIGDSPFAGMSDNLFMLREAVKCGTPINFARREFSAEKRLQNLDVEWKRRGGQGSVLDFVRPALKKDRAARCSAQEWVELAESMTV